MRNLRSSHWRWMVLAIGFWFISNSHGQDKKDTPNLQEIGNRVEKVTKDIADLKQSTEQASKNAAEGKVTATVAQKIAEDAKKNVDDLKKTADDAKKSADGALKTAEGAQKTAEDAKKLAQEAKQAADTKKEPPAPKGDEETKKLATVLASENNERIQDIAEAKKTASEGKTAASDAKTEGSRRGDTAWLLISTALVMFMLPGLALFYGGMVRRKNILATMMHSYAALAVVGLYWVVAGYGLAFGPSIISISDGGIVGWSWDLFCLQGVKTDDYLPAYNIPVYVHVMFQGMFAIITPALISGAIAERVRFWPFTIFMLLWVTLVYCPLAHMVWAFDFFYADPVDPKKGLGGSAVGLLGKMGALDFAGGTVVHIAAGVAGLACALVLRKRHGYPEHAMHPNSVVLTLLGAGLLWFGWFGFNGGSSLTSSPLGGSAFAATQVATCAAGLSWIFVEWITKGKPTALGMASGIVAGLVAITPASGYVQVKGAIVIGLIAGAVCYFAVRMKSRLGYDDTLDAFGVHAVGGFIGAVLTGIFCYTAVNSAGADGYFAMQAQRERIPVLEKEIPDLEKKIEELGKKVEPLQDQIDDLQDEIDGRQRVVDQLDRDVVTLKKMLKKKPDDAVAQKKLEEAEKLIASIKVGSEGQKDNLQSLTEKQTALKDEQFPDKEKFDRYTAKLESLKKEKSTLEDITKAQDKDGKGRLTQFFIQFKAASLAVVLSFVLSLGLTWLVQIGSGGNFTTSKEKEIEGVDLTEHGENGFDFGTTLDTIPTASGAEPRAAKVPPGAGKRFEVIVEGIENGGLIKKWSELCMPSEQPVDPDFKAVYPYVTTVQGNRFRLRGGDPKELSGHLLKLFQKVFGKQVKVRVEE